MRQNGIRPARFRFARGGSTNTKRMNRLEELGRVDAEKADTKKGKRNLREEKSRIVSELKAKGGKVGGRRRKMGPDASDTPRKGRSPGARDRARGKKGRRKSFPDLTGDGKVTRADVLKGRGVFKSGGIAKRGRGCEIR